MREYRKFLSLSKKRKTYSHEMHMLYTYYNLCARLSKCCIVTDCYTYDVLCTQMVSNIAM